MSVVLRPVAIISPCYGCNEVKCRLSQKRHQLASVPTPRVDKPDVNNREGGQISSTAVGLIGGVVGLWLELA